jgi:GT2 family glycosyltransferase
MNPVVMITYNNLYYTKMAIDSALAQDIPIDLVVVNNGSTDGTRQWLSDLATMVENVTVIHLDRNESPIKVFNGIAKTIFANSPYLLGMPNDVKLPPNCYSEMLKWPRGFVSASDIGQNEPETRPARAVSENTPMAVMLIRSWAHQALIAKDGYFFDERFFHYGSDCDLALRMAACGIRGVQLDLPFYHYGSASLRLADPFTQERLGRGANEDRRKFVEKWGFEVTSLEYGKMASDPNWRGE